MRKSGCGESGYGRGSVRQRGPGLYEARIQIQGKTFRRSADTAAKAQAHLDGFLEGAAKGRLERTLDARNMTLAEGMRRRLDLTSLKSAEGQRRSTERLIAEYPVLCAKSLYDIDEIDVGEFVEARLAEDVSNSTVNRDLAIFSSTFSLARAKLGCVGLVNPIGRKTRLTENPGRLRRLNPEEEVLLLRCARQYVDSTVPIADIITVACETAMRFSEIAGMMWEHLDLAAGVVHLPDTKNGTPRNVPLWPSVRALLRALGPRESGPVWPKPEAIRSAWRRVREAAIACAVAEKRAGLAQSLANLRFHDFRHEGTSRLIERTGWSDAQIMAVTGHKTSAMLARYAHLRADRLAAAMTALEGGAEAMRLVAKGPQEEAELPEDLQQRVRWRLISSSRELLQALVDAKPIVAIGVEYGVSDVAVHKACRRLGVEKKQSGHWLRTRAA